MSNRLEMTKLPNHLLQTIRPHVSPAFDETKEKGLLCERLDIHVVLI